MPSLALEAGDNRVGLGATSLQFQPAWRLRQVAPHPPDDGAAERTGDKYPPPSVDAKRLTRHERAGEKSHGGHADEPQGVSDCRVPPPMARRQELTEIRIDQREFRADADARDKPRRDQHLRARRKRAK